MTGRRRIGRVGVATAAAAGVGIAAGVVFGVVPESAARRPEWLWHGNGREAAWFVPQDALRAVAELVELPRVVPP